MWVPLFSAGNYTKWAIICNQIGIVRFLQIRVFPVVRKFLHLILLCRKLLTLCFIPHWFWALRGVLSWKKVGIGHPEVYWDVQNELSRWPRDWGADWLRKRPQSELSLLQLYLNIIWLLSSGSAWLQKGFYRNIHQKCNYKITRDLLYR